MFMNSPSDLCLTDRIDQPFYRAHACLDQGFAPSSANGQTIQSL
jgi:hypothetical protein